MTHSGGAHLPLYHPVIMLFRSRSSFAIPTETSNDCLMQTPPKHLFSVYHYVEVTLRLWSKRSVLDEFTDKVKSRIYVRLFSCD